jgi:L-alanine-DL-glutamate epimerase-like enolase superfamily enzyme
MSKAIGELLRDGGLPIATGENLHTLYEFKQMIASGGIIFPEAEVTNCGGATASIKNCSTDRGLQFTDYFAWCS